MDAIVYDKVGKEAEKVREALYGIYPQETITDAAIASFDDGADGMPIKKLVANIEPVQDLHGYDSPWPAGGGKNLYQAKDGSYSYAAGITKNVVNGAIGLTGTANSEFDYHPLTGSIDDATQLTLPAGTYTASISGLTSGMKYIMGSSGSEIPYHEIQTDGSYTFTLSAEGGLGYDILRIASGTSVNTTVKIQVEAGSTATPWASNSNICPISGWTGAEVKRTGKNLFDKEKPLAAGLIDASGEIVDNLSYQHTDYFTKVFPSTQYVFSGGIVNSGIYNSIAFYDKNKSFISRFVPSASGVGSSFITPSNCEFIRFNVANSTNINLNTIQLELGSTATDYEAFRGETVEVTFPTSAGTVYGGTLTINPDRTGTLVVDRAMVDLGTLTWDYSVSGNLFFYAYKPDIKLPTGWGAIPDWICSMYKTVSGNNISSGIIGIGGNPNNSQVRVCDLVYTTVADFKAAVTGQSLVYELATPITYQLTSTEISAILTTLYGTNNIWADTGNIEELTYRADLGKYIDSHITTAVANALNA